MALPTFFLGANPNVKTLGHFTYQQMVSEEIALNPRWVARYAEDIFAFHKEQEVLLRPNPDYLQGSTWVTQQQRAGLMDAVVSACS